MPDNCRHDFEEQNKLRNEMARDMYVWSFPFVLEDSGVLKEGYIDEPTRDRLRKLSVTVRQAADIYFEKRDG